MQRQALIGEKRIAEWSFDSTGQLCRSSDDTVCEITLMPGEFS